MKIIVRFKANSEAYFFDGAASYWVVRYYHSGSSNRYHVFIMTADDPVRIGCELPLDNCKNIIREYEHYFKKHPDVYLGDREAMLSVRKIISDQRKKKYAK